MEIRLATGSDAEGVRAIYAPVVESTPISFEFVVPSVAEMASRILDRQPSHPWLVADVSGSVVGYAYAGRFSGRAGYDWSVETSVYVSELARGGGVGKALYRGLLEILTAQGYRRVMAGIALPNDASVALHEGCGFALVGIYHAVGWKLGAWHDVGWWERSLVTVDGPPQATIAFTDLPAGVVEGAFEAAVAFQAGRHRAP